MNLFTITLLAGLSFGASAALAQQPAAANIENGKKHYTTDGCYQCHGTLGNGAAISGPKLSNTELPFEAFLMQLRQPANEMPPYEAKIISDATVADIYAYMKSLPPSPDAKSLPLLTGMGVK